MRRRCLLGATLLLSLAAPHAPATEGEEQAIAIVGAKLIDGTGAAPMADAVVVVREDRIVAAGSRSDVAAPANAAIVEATGQVLMPGLIDLHCHYGGGADGLRRQFALQLSFGVTTARSLGADDEGNLAVIAAANAGEFRAPRLYTAGRGFSHPDGLPPGVPMINRPTTPEQARAMVRALAELDVDLVKMWVDDTLDGSLAMRLPKIAPEIRTAIVQEATRLGLPAVARVMQRGVWLASQ